MRMRSGALVAAGAATLFLATSAVDAASMRTGMGARANVGRSTVGARAQFVPSGFHQGRKVGWHGRHVPAGWSEGRKVGWHHHPMPPGLR